MENRCCICKESGSGIFYKKISDRVLLSCKNCRLVYLDKLPDENNDFIKTAKAEISRKDREKVEYWSFPDLYEKYKKVFLYYFNERLNRIKQFKPDIKSLFDIGCGYGFWLEFCKDRGIDIGGIDLSEEAVSYAKTRLCLNTERSSLEDYEFNKNYDVIVVCDLLEHLYEPNAQLKKINRALSKTGILFIQIPNLLGFKLPPFHGFGLPYHIWQFDIRTLKKLLEKNDFEILRWWTGVMGVIGVYESGDPSIFDRIMWQLAKRLKIGNRLMAVAKKI